MKIKGEQDELKDFSALGVSAFDFWENVDDDVYDEFYKNRTKKNRVD